LNNLWIIITNEIRTTAVDTIGYYLK
jgi:hypothetical protein